MLAVQFVELTYLPTRTREPLVPKLKVPEKVAVIEPAVFASVAATLVKDTLPTVKLPLVMETLQFVELIYEPTRAREPLEEPEPKPKVPENLAVMVPAVSANVAVTLVKDTPPTLRVPLVTFAVQLSADV